MIVVVFSFFKLKNMNILSEKGNFTTIFHISDIHIRLYSRREEYEHVFQNLYRFLSNHPNVSQSVIVITGDILHNKIDLTPECVLMTYSFLESLGKIAPTLFIAGNHDALLNNRERMDSLTPILYHRTPPGVFYLKNTGHYRFGNLVFSVNSLLDDVDWLDLNRSINAHKEDFQGKIKIALYHGQICGWKNNIGFASDSGDKNVDDFDGYDYVLLGDIHKFQYMNASKTMAYSGSLVSQNFGETDPQHGVLCWDLIGKTSELVPMENPYRYCEAILHDDELEILYENTRLDWRVQGNLALHISNQCNMRVQLTDNVDVNHEFIHAFKTGLPRAKLQQKFSYASKKKDPHKENKITVTPEVGDTFWIRTFVLEKLQGHPLPILEKLIEELIREYNQNVSLCINAESPCWEIKSIRFDNMFGYGEGNVIDFEKLHRHTITGIFGRNSCGKSTLIDIITFLLFGKITRGSHGNSIPREVIHVSEKKAFGEIVFQVGNQLYKVSKHCVRQKNDKIKITEQLSLWTDGNWKDYSEEHRKKTDKVIESLLGNLESFVFTNVCTQQREKHFREMTQKDRKEFLYNLFGLDWFEKFRREKEDQFKKLKGEEKVYHEKVGDQTSVNWTERLQDVIVKIEPLETNLQKLGIDLKKLEVEKEAIWSRIKKTRFENLGNAKEKKKSIERTLDDIDKKINSIATEKQGIRLFLDNCNLFLIRQKLEALEKEKSDLESCDILSKNPHPEVLRWIKKDHQEWNEYYKDCKKLFSESENITKDWESKKQSLENEIRNLDRQLLPFDKKMVCVEDWDTLQQKKSKFDQEIPLLEAKMNEPLPDIPRQLEEDAEIFQKKWTEYQIILCSVNMKRQNIKEAKEIEFNPECVACQKNPFYRKQTKLQNELSKEESKLYQIEQNIFEVSDRIRGVLKDLPSNKTSVQTLSERISEELLLLRKMRSESIKKREQYQKKLDYYLQMRIKYINTSAFLENQKHQERLEYSQKLLKEDAAKILYDRLLLVIKYASVYEELDLFFQGGSRRTLCEMEEETQKYQKLEMDHQTKTSRLEKIQEESLSLQTRSLEAKHELETILEDIKVLEENLVLHEKKSILDVQKQQKEKKRVEMNEQLLSIRSQHERIKTQKIEWEINYEQWKATKQTMYVLELLIECVDRDGLPIFLLKNYLPLIESDINQLIHTFLDKKMALRVVEKDVVVGLEQSSTALSNYLGGMESFIVDLSLKTIFSKFSRLPKSNFFVIDEGISVLDQERISNIGSLFNFLTSVSEQVFLISHLPTVKDFVSQSIEITKNQDQKSVLQCCF